MSPWIPILTAALLSGPAWAGEAEPTYDRVSLSASAVQSVENDILTAELFAQAEGQDASALSNEVNERVAWAVEQAKAINGISVRSLDYQTHPVYRNNRVDGWRVSQALRLESSDSEVLSGLVGKLQERLSVRSLGYEVSPQQRQSAEDALIERAVATFRARAQRVAEAFGNKGYRIVEVRVGSSGQDPRPPFFAARGVAMADAAAAPPALEAGTQEVRIEVSGTIELE